LNGFGGGQVTGGRPRLGLAAGLVALGYAASLVADYPGHFTYDSVWQLAQGREGVFNGWHPPVMAWLLGLADRAWSGAWLYFVFQGALFYSALLAFMAFEPRPRLIGLLVLALWLVSPIVLIFQGTALKDILFADAALAGFACLAWAGELWAWPWRRYPLLLSAFALLCLAALARQNGIIAPACAVLGLALMVLVRTGPAGQPGSRIWSAIAHGALAGAAVVLVLFAANWAFEAHSDHRPENDNHRKVLQVYDLAGAVHRDRSLSLAILDREQPGLAAFIRQKAAPLYQAATVESLSRAPQAEAMMSPKGGALGRQWASLIVSRPWLYVKTRAAVWEATVMTPPSADCPMFLIGVDSDDAANLRAAGLTPRDNAKDDWDDDYARGYVGTPLCSHAFYGVLLLLVMASNLRRWRRGDRSPALIATLAMGAAALLFVASYFVISIACDYRYLYFLDVAAMAAVLREAAARRPRL
jgi:hypothetical protein